MFVSPLSRSARMDTANVFGEYCSNVAGNICTDKPTQKNKVKNTQQRPRGRCSKRRLQRLKRGELTRRRLPENEVGILIFALC